MSCMNIADHAAVIWSMHLNELRLLHALFLALSFFKCYKNNAPLVLGENYAILLLYFSFIFPDKLDGYLPIDVKHAWAHKNS